MASKTTEDAKLLKGNDGKTTYMLKDIGSIEWVKNTLSPVDSIFKSV
jgi:hypothetical protein